MPYDSAARERYRRNAAEFRALMSTTPCTDCGHTFPYYIMEWDHVPGRGSKKVKISTLVGINKSSPFFLKEIEKCDIVCRNCHGLRTHVRTCDNEVCICRD